MKKKQKSLVQIYVVVVVFADNQSAKISDIALHIF
jgi:hypothetical protein